MFDYDTDNDQYGEEPYGIDGWAYCLAYYIGQGLSWPVRAYRKALAD